MSYSELEAQVYGLSLKDKEAFQNRYYYEDRLDKIFERLYKDDRPNVPGGLCAGIIDTSVSHLFPGGTVLRCANKQLEDTLKAITESTKILELLSFIGTEGHITGTVGLKSIWEDDLKHWTLDVHCLEALEVEHDPLNTSNILAIRIRFRYQVKTAKNQTKTYWWQERWTAADYTQWEPQEETQGMIPDFTNAAIDTEASGPHDYGEIPITIIAHQVQVDSPYGLPEINERMKAYSRALSVSLSNVDVAGQLITKPTYKRLNDKNQTPVVIKSGAIIEIQGDGDQPADLLPLEHPDTPQSVFEHQKKIKALAYESAQVTNPDVEKEMKAGGTVSSVAWKAFNYKFVKKVKRLRVQYGDLGIEAHIEKLFRMGKVLKKPGFDAVNLEDPASYEVQLDYPAFFEPTAEEKTIEIALLKSSNLPASELGRRIAAILGIDQEDVIQEIIANIEEEREALKPNLLVE